MNVSMQDLLVIIGQQTVKIAYLEEQAEKAKLESAAGNAKPVQSD